MRRPPLRLTTLFALILICAAAIAPAAAEERRILTFEDADYFGFDYETLKNRSLDQCRAACLDDERCRAFTYNAQARWCFLKDDYAELRATPGAIAGRVTAYVRDDTETAPALPFLTGNMVREAETYARDLARKKIDPSRGVAGVTQAAEIAFGQDLPGDSAKLYRLALRVTQDDWTIWSGLARAALSIDGQTYDQRRQLMREATAAGYYAYRTAPGLRERAEALALLARALEARSQFRAALEAYKESLLLADNQEIRAAYEELREQHGFRLVDYTVETESAAPRACLRFSEELKAGRDGLADFVRIDQQPADAVSVDGWQLCVEGLEHGQTYQVGVRTGLPSVVGEVLERPLALSVYVRDRSPSARFTGRNFVLPRVGSHGIPVVTVNTEALDVALYRIPERALSETLSRAELFSQLNSYTANDIAENRGAEIWSGTLDVERRLNEEVTTSFPIDEALPLRQPGVYVMLARPQEGRDEPWRAQATQWFVVSDIGLTTFMGRNGLRVLTRSLASAEALSGVDVTLVARNNDVLAKAKSGVDGTTHFPAGLTRGEGGNAPAYVSATLGGVDFAFLDLTGPGFDLSDRGVEGRPAPGPLDVFLYTERGVYRPGATVHLSALVRDGNVHAVEDTPLTVMFLRPDGVEQRRMVVRDQGAGGYAVDFDLLDDAMRGTWRIAVHADPKAPPLADMRFLVEDFVPDRIEFDLETQAERFAIDEATEFTVDGRYLYGADAAGLRLEGDLTLRPVRTMEDFEGYVFGLADEGVLPSRAPIDGLPATDDDGTATLAIAAGTVPASTQPLEAVVAIRMREGSGQAVERTAELPVARDAAYIGIKPLFSDLTVSEGSDAAFDLIAATPGTGDTVIQGAEWQLLRIERNFQWYEVNGTWSYEAVSYSTRVASGEIDLASGESVRISAPVTWGRYRFEVAGAQADDPASSVDFTAGWYVEVGNADAPDVLDVALDKQAYAPGETARVSLTPRFDGKAVIAVMNESLLETREVDVVAQGTVVEINVNESWGTGAYVAAVAFRPSDSEASRMPGRAVGLAWLGVDVEARTVAVTLDAPAQIAPNTTLDIPIRVSGIGAAETAYVTVAAVDVGILNLTAYEPPDPRAWYLGQRRLGLEMRDLYGRLIDGMLGTAGTIRSGGDVALLQTVAPPPAQAPVALFSGIVELDENGDAVIPFDVPDFAGTLRVMAVAWTRTAVGQATSDVIVRDPVVMTLALPRFLAPGDRAQVRLDIDNLDGPAGAYSADVSFTNEIEVETEDSQITLAAGERAVRTLGITALEPGVATLTVRLRHENGIDITRRYRLGVRPAQPASSDRQVASLAPDAALELDGERLDGYVPGSAAVTLAVSRAGAIDVPSLLHALDRYPYGCAEQITSRALPLLYLSEVAEQSGLGSQEELAARIQKAVFEAIGHQSSSGSFGLWGPGSGDLWLNAYVTDFLTRARESGYDVPDTALDQALNNLQNALGYAPEVDGAGQDVAYALYVLARNRRASLGDLRYYVDTRLTSFGSAMAKAHIGAALALYGEASRANTAFDAALADLGAQPTDAQGQYYGSALRDGAATLALAAESTPAPVPLDALSDIVSDLRARADITSTQENAWLLLAARALLESGDDIALVVNGEAHQGNYLDRFIGEALDLEPVRLVNRGDQPIDVVLTTTGIPQTPLPASGTGFTIERQVYLLDGTPIAIDEVAQNERFVVVLDVEQEAAGASRMLVADLIPAGFQIDNPSLVKSADLEAFSWLDEAPGAAHLEFRDDRFVAALETPDRGPRRFTFAYMVRAVTPGSYAVPPALVEDMYRPYLNARTATGRTVVVGPTP